MANEEISNQNPKNEYNKSMSMTPTLNPAVNPGESQLNAAMNGQHKDSLVNDAAFIGKVHSDSTNITPKVTGDVPSEKSIFNGTLHEQMIGGKKGNIVDFHKG